MNFTFLTDIINKVFFKFFMESLLVANKKSNSYSIVLTDDVTIEHISSIKAQFLEAISQNSTIILDISEVQTVDISFIQLILSAHLEALNNEKKFYVKGPFSQQIHQLLKSISISLPVLEEESNV